MTPNIVSSTSWYLVLYCRVRYCSNEKTFWWATARYSGVLVCSLGSPHKPVCPKGCTIAVAVTGLLSGQWDIWELGDTFPIKTPLHQFGPPPGFKLVRPWKPMLILNSKVTIDYVEQNLYSNFVVEMFLWSDVITVTPYSIPQHLAYYIITTDTH